MEDTMYTAALATASDVVSGDFCDVSVVENEVISYRQGTDGYDIPVYGMTSVVALDAVETTVRTDADNYGAAETEADDILAANGWVRTGDWEPSDNAYYAPVERADNGENADSTDTAVWSVVRGESPTSRAVEPGIVGVTVPDEVLTWAEGHGHGPDDTSVYLLVTPKDEAGEVAGEIAWREFPMQAGDIALIREELNGNADA